MPPRLACAKLWHYEQNCDSVGQLELKLEQERFSQDLNYGLMNILQNVPPDLVYVKSLRLKFYFIVVGTGLCNQNVMNHL